MKYFYKIFCFLILTTPNLFARDYILFETNSKKTDLTNVKKVLTEKFHLPEKLLKLKRIESECTPNVETVIHFCEKSNGEISIINIKKFIVKNSLEVFWESNQGVMNTAGDKDDV